MTEKKLIITWTHSLAHNRHFMAFETYIKDERISGMVIDSDSPVYSPLFNSLEFDRDQILKLFDYLEKEFYYSKMYGDKK